MSSRGIDEIEASLMASGENIEVFVRLRDEVYSELGENPIEDVYNGSNVSGTLREQIKAFFEKFSGKIVDVSRLYNQEVIDEIKKINPDYELPQFFFKYFVIECDNLIIAYEVERYVEENLANIIVKVYIPSVSDPPGVNLCPQQLSQYIFGHLEPGRKGVGQQALVTLVQNNNVPFVDLERGWGSHPDLYPYTIYDYNFASGKPHGTKVLGIIARKSDGGMVPYGIDMELVSYELDIVPKKNKKRRLGPSISLAAAWLDNEAKNTVFELGGSVLLLEVQVNQSSHKKDQSYALMPCDTQLDCYEAIWDATDKMGIIVIEAAGNGSRYLDEFEYFQTKIRGPAQPKYIFDVNNVADFRDSGAIMVGASNPNISVDPVTGIESVTHKKGGGSNYGLRVDCFAWGDEVCTCLDGGKYGIFTGTSAASAIIAGLVILIQDYRITNSMDAYSGKAGNLNMRKLLSEPFNTRSNLRAGNDPNYGTAYDANPLYNDEDYIGIMPCLEKLLGSGILDQPYL